MRLLRTMLAPNPGGINVFPDERRFQLMMDALNTAWS
jgi:hypothetical protein